MVSTDYRLGLVLWLPWWTETLERSFFLILFVYDPSQQLTKVKANNVLWSGILLKCSKSHVVSWHVCRQEVALFKAGLLTYICVNGCSNHMFHSTKSFLQSAPNHIPTRRIHTCESTAQRFKKYQKATVPSVSESKTTTLHTFQIFPSHPVTSPNFSGQISGFHVGFHDGPYVANHLPIGFPMAKPWRNPTGTPWHPVASLSSRRIIFEPSPRSTCTKVNSKLLGISLRKASYLQYLFFLGQAST